MKPALDRMLLESIRENGMFYPLTVVANPKKPGHYLVVHGLRRFECAKKLGITCACDAFATDAPMRLRSVCHIQDQN
jgi:ParB-like chromosome segregation protein Spo0J